MIIFGVDPGTATTGFGVLRVNKFHSVGEKLNGHYEALDFGLIETESIHSAGERLHLIHDELVSHMRKAKPDVMVIEKVFFSTNRKTAINVGQAIGVMLMAASVCKLEVVQYAPGTIKKVVAGHGRADKKEIQQSLRDVLGARIRSRPMKKTHFDNAADALAVALCHAFTINTFQSVAQRTETLSKVEVIPCA